MAHHLPPESTPFEKALSEAIDWETAVGASIEASRGLVYARPLNVSFAPYLLEQYGLGNIGRFFDTIEDAIDAGIPWLRILGKPEAIETALSWIGYDNITIWHQWPGRRKWNRYQIDMGLVPEVELPLLLDAEYLADLSDPARSVFFRGFEGYDVRATVWSGFRWGNALWGDSSGVRIEGGTVKWSHGEDDTGAIVAGSTERTALGIDYEEGEALTWGEIPWDAPGVTWEGIQDLPAFKSYMLRRLPVYVGFYDADGEAIGFRRPIAVRDVTADHTPAEGHIVIEVECRTGFGDGVGHAVDHCSLVFRAGNANAAKPGKQWLDPDEIVFEDGYSAADMTIGSVDLDFTFRHTVRQHVTLTFEI